MESINKSIEQIFVQCFKRRVSDVFSDYIDGELDKTSIAQNPPSETSVEDIVTKISSLEKFSDLQRELVQEVERLFDDDDDFEMLLQSSLLDHHNPDSLTGSLSSLNSYSIDFLSGEQLKDIAYALDSVSVVQKIEALGTLCRLSTLEHITKQTLWAEIEAQLHRLICGDVDVLRDGSLSLFVKMLSSPEPQVVLQGFLSLLKIVPDILPHDLHDPISPQFKFPFRVLKTINKFQQHIPSCWLRYPHKVLNDIIGGSVAFLDTQPELLWRVIMYFDLKANWLRNFAYGSVGRSFLFRAFKDHTRLLHRLYGKCQLFKNVKLHHTKCCNNVSVQEQIHVICSLSYFLRYTGGRELLDSLYADKDGWKIVLNVVMNLVWQLSDSICIQCFVPLFETIPYVCSGFYDKDDVEKLFRSLALHTVFSEQKVVGLFGSFLLAECLCKLLRSPTQAEIASSIQIGNHNVLPVIINHFTAVIRSLDVRNCNFSRHSKSVFRLVKKILSIQLDIRYEYSAYLNSLKDLLQVFVDIRRSVEETAVEDAEYQQLIHETCLEFLRKPITILICHESNVYMDFVCSLLDKINRSISSHESCCCDTMLLLSALSYDFDSSNNSEHITKLEAISSAFHANWDFVESSELAVFFYKVFVPCIVSNLPWPQLENSVSMFMRCLLLRPHAAPNDLLHSEENIVCALKVLSIICYDFDMVCILYKYNVPGLLMQMLSEFMCDDGDVMISPVTVLLNFNIIKLYCVSGPGEVVLPCKELSEVGVDYSFPFVLTYPPHLEYHAEFDTSYDLTGLNQVDINSLGDVQNVVLKHFKKHECLTGEALSTLIVKSLDFMDVSDGTSDQLQEGDSIGLDEQIVNGIDITVRCSAFIGHFSEDIKHDLERLQTSFPMCIMNSGKKYDVFISCVYLALQCNSTDATMFLKKFANCQTSIFPWKCRSLQPSQQNRANWAIVLECCDYIVMNYLPTVFCAFKACGVLPSLIYDHWTEQCYWNYLDWPEICDFVALLSIFGGDYALYYFVSVLSHLKSNILCHSYSLDIISHMRSHPIDCYRLSDHVDFIMELGEECGHHVNKMLQHIIM